MSEVIGPCTTLPGARHHLPEGEKCDLHPDRPAVARVQGETDSMGAELNDMCQGCLDEHRKYNKERDRSGVCDWCKTQQPRLSTARDYDEGLHGRVYDVCAGCIKKRDDRIQQELDRFQDYDDDYDDDLDNW